MGKKSSAPEQVERPTEVDHRADIYSIGASMFELAVGRVPYPKGDAAYHHMHSPVPDPREVRQAIPDALAELLMACMAKKPDDRPNTARDVVDALRSLG